MQIIHKLDDFLFTIFPELIGGGNDLIISTLQTYYAYGPFKPAVSIHEGWVTIQLDTPTILAQEADYKKVVALCEKGRYAEAKPLLHELIKKNPANSEYHRILGQILSDEGDQDEAINCLIDALRWDSKNGWALLMMGNIFAKYKKDVDTALKYYDQALIANTRDHISLTNIGYLLFQQDKNDAAKKYLYEALKINPQYANAHLVLGFAAQQEHDLPSAFYSATEAMRHSVPQSEVYKGAYKLAFECARNLALAHVGKQLYRQYSHTLEAAGGMPIHLEEDNAIPTAAKIEFAENYGRDTHVVRYKVTRLAVEHLIMHELVHLDFVIQARAQKQNQLFTSTQEHKQRFEKLLGDHSRKLRKEGVSEPAVKDYVQKLFQGLNLQVFNAPVDLFIEQFLYTEFPDLRPYQFLSLHGMLQEGIMAVTDKQVVAFSPVGILSKSKVYNLVGALQFKELFGLDLTHEYKATPAERKQAQGFYHEYLQYKDDRQPGEEYELLQHWAEDLQLDKFFELVDEQHYRTQRTNIDQLLKSIEQDPLDADTTSPQKQRDMQKFLQGHEQSGLNAAVMMYMVDALQYLQNKPPEEVKKIAFEIAMQGAHGYRPDKQDYRLSTVPGKTFSGYHILAWYYVTWALSAPDKLAALQLPYEKEYEAALKIYHK